MDNDKQNLIKALRGFKLQGLSRYESIDRLRKLGYSQPQIDDAEDEIDTTLDETSEEKAEESSTNDGTKAATSSDSSSLNKAYAEVGSTLLNSGEAKRPKTFQLFSGNLLTKSYSSYGEMAGFGNITARVFLALVISIGAVIYLGQHYPVHSNQATYCSAIEFYHEGKFTRCTSGQADYYGWPIKGQNTIYHLSGSFSPSVQNRGIFYLNYGIWILTVYLALRLIAWLIRSLL